MIGQVYFVAFGVDGGHYVKIGWTRGSVAKRTANLQTGCPYPLDILAAVDGPIEDEKALHRHFSDKRECGEWFFFDDLEELWPVIGAAGSRASYGQGY